MDDTLQTFTNGHVAQHPVDQLGIGVGVPRLLVGRATGNQEAARASGVPAWSASHSPEGLVDDLPHWQVPRLVARAWPGGGGLAESCEHWNT